MVHALPGEVLLVGAPSEPLRHEGADLHLLFLLLLQLLYPSHLLLYVLVVEARVGIFLLLGFPIPRPAALSGTLLLVDVGRKCALSKLHQNLLLLQLCQVALLNSLIVKPLPHLIDRLVLSIFFFLFEFFFLFVSSGLVSVLCFEGGLEGAVLELILSFDPLELLQLGSLHPTLHQLTEELIPTFVF